MAADWLFGFENCGCNCYDCALRDDTFTNLDEFTQISGTWTATGGNLTTSDANAIILWDGTYDEEIGAGIRAAWDENLRAILDYVDTDNYHFIEFSDYATTSLINAAVTCLRAKVYKRTAGVDTLLYDFLLGASDPAVEQIALVRPGFINIGSLQLTTTLHGGDKIGVGTSSAGAAVSLPSVAIRKYGVAPGSTCLNPGNRCPQCFTAEGVADMAVTLELNNSCGAPGNGVALAETTFVLPFTGRVPGGASGCVWFLDAGLPCGWRWLALEKFSLLTGASEVQTHCGFTGTFYVLYIARWDNGNEANYTLVYFRIEAGNPTANAYSCLLGPYPISESVTIPGRICRNAAGFDTSATDFELDVCAVEAV